MLERDIASHFTQHLRVVRADTEALRRDVFRIRYRVYAQELGWEPSEQFPDKMERDDYDRQSLHFLTLHRATATWAGCVRLVLADSPINARDSLLPFERYCGESLRRDCADPATLPRGSFGEISRLAVLGRFRRRKGEAGTPFGISTDEAPPAAEEQRSPLPLIPLGLYIAAASAALEHGLDSAYAMMEPRLARRLRALGITFEQVGDVMDYHGPRAAFRITRETLLTGMRPELRDLLATVQQQLNSDSKESDQDRDPSLRLR